MYVARMLPESRGEILRLLLERTLAGILLRADWGEVGEWEFNGEWLSREDYGVDMWIVIYDPDNNEDGPFSRHDTELEARIAFDGDSEAMYLAKVVEVK